MLSWTEAGTPRTARWRTDGRSPTYAAVAQFMYRQREGEGTGSKLMLDVFNVVTDLGPVANDAIAPGGKNVDAFRFAQVDPHAADTSCRHRRNP